MEELVKKLSNKKIQNLSGIILVLGIILFPILFPDQTFKQYLLCTLGIYIIVNTGFDVLFGYSGQMSLGQAGFYAIGAYFSALLSKAGIPVLLSILMASSIAAIVGYFIAFPCSKLLHHFLAMVTIAFGEIIRLLAINCGPVTGGVDGIARIPPLNILGYKFISYTSYLYLILAVALLLIFTKSRIVNSHIGRVLLAIRGNPDASEAFGIQLPKYKAMAFTVSSFYAGIGGALYAHLVRFISPESFSGEQSSMFLVMLLIGGMGTLLGPLIGSVLMLMISEFLQQFGQFQMMIYGLIIIVVLLVMPNGIAGTFKNKYYHYFYRIPRNPKIKKK